MIRELSRAIELSAREGGRNLEAEGIWEGLGWGWGEATVFLDGLPCSSASLSSLPSTRFQTVPRAIC